MAALSFAAPVAPAAVPAPATARPSVVQRGRWPGWLGSSDFQVSSGCETPLVDFEHCSAGDLGAWKDQALELLQLVASQEHKIKF